MRQYKEKGGNKKGLNWIKLKLMITKKEKVRKIFFKYAGLAAIETMKTITPLTGKNVGKIFDDFYKELNKIVRKGGDKK